MDNMAANKRLFFMRQFIFGGKSNVIGLTFTTRTIQILEIRSEHVDTQDLKTELIKIAPPTGVAMTTVLGIPLSDWVYLATIVYILIQCLCLVYKTFFKKGRKKDVE